MSPLFRLLASNISRVSDELSIPASQWRWVCLGLGRLTSRKSLYQLALFLLLQERMTGDRQDEKGWLFDPVLTASEYSFLRETFGILPLQEANDPGVPFLANSSHVVYFMPHCPWALIDAMMETFSATRPQPILLIIGNALSKLGVK